MNWVSVEKDLPPPNQRVLIYCGLGAGSSGAAAGSIEIAFVTSNGWRGLNGQFNPVTHWMALPAAPVDAHFEGIKFAADSILSQYVPAAAAINDLNFKLTSDGCAYRVYYAKDAGGYWQFKNYEII